MPKLNVQQNNQNVIQAFKNALAIGNLKGIIASDGSHNFSTAGSNRNLLDNPWFTVRQRGDGPFGAGAGYTVDRWTKFYNGIITGTDDGVSIAPNTTSGWIEFAQYLPADVGAALEGKTVTLSALLQDGTLYSKSGVCAAKPSSGTTNFITVSMPNSMGFVAGRRNDGVLRVEFTYGQAYSQDPLNVRAAKLELGSVSTIANDVPPDYGEELAKCQRYFIRLKGEPLATGYLSTNMQYAYMLIPTSRPMRTTPSVSYSGSFSIRIYNSTKTATAMNAASPLFTAGGVGLRITLDSAASAYGPCAMFAGSTSDYIDLSADL